MLLYLFKRLALGVVIVMLAVTLLFCMIHLVPGDPARILLGPRATPELIASMSARMGLDLPLPVQILKFFGNLFRGDLGMDVITNRPVAEIVFGQLPYTLWLIFSAIGFAALIGIPLGCYSALHRNTLIDRITGILSVACITVPAFVVALVFPAHIRRDPAMVSSGGRW